MVVGEGVGHLHRECAGKTVLPVGRDIFQAQRRVVPRHHVPHAVGKPGVTAMRDVAAASLLQHIGHTVEGKARTLDAAHITAHHAAEVLLLARIVIDVVEAQHHVAQMAFLVGHHHRHHTGTIVGDACFQAIVGQGVEGSLLAIDSGDKAVGTQTRECGRSL